MACISTSTRTSLLARKSTIEALITAAEAMLAKASETDTGHVQSFRFDSGEGSQQTRYRSYEEMLKYLDGLYSRLDSITRRLNGTGIVAMNLRRKQFGLLGTSGRRF